jgi:hypothetical protein
MILVVLGGDKEVGDMVLVTKVWSGELFLLCAHESQFPHTGSLC